MTGFLFLSAAFDPFGSAPSTAKPQDFIGAFLGPGNVGPPEPLLHATRSPSPTMQSMSLGKACAYASVCISSVCVCRQLVSSSLVAVFCWHGEGSRNVTSPCGCYLTLSWTRRCSCYRQYVISSKCYMHLRPYH